ncbi:VWA domain-containing protein [Pseudoalteromonas shioyasakiensis]|uniref:VWA domain-containing protein n=1 Tax=Pseudoalteromonas shioyasakiensis TaxID=1190813 RepID=UPI00211997B0|nr:VWA domain-containing protein [Pseudoalteromonas shioyasakiensis]MCQ8882368.1 VWA domain-containing protein [Pseudoalteromonas shioyasakiensis]
MDFEFIRPALLWLLLPALIIFSVLLVRNKKNAPADLIAPHLAQFVMSDNHKKQSQPLWLVAIFTLLAIVFAAGPSFEKKQVPVFQAKNARVIVMDMSYSMFSTDIAPNRLVQARFKALDMIELFKEGDTALVAYAGSAFTISPLTNDASTLANLIPSLSPDIMPSKGSNVIEGLEKADDLLKQAGYLDGDIILVTDGVDSLAQEDISRFTAQSSYRLNVYGVGTEQGAPIKLPEGGFLKDSQGQIVIPTLNISRLSALARNSGGKFALYQTSNQDIQTFAPTANAEVLKDEKQSQALWRVDAGIYGLVILLPLALFLIRRSSLVLGLLFVMLLPQQQVYAAELPEVFKNQDQRALDAYQQNQFEQAAQAENTQLKGAALYQQGNYQAAMDAFSEDKSATGLYNYGNALAKAGELEQAIEAYKKAQQLKNDFTEAKENQALVEQLMQQQEQQQQQDQQQNTDQQNSDGQQDNQQKQQGENSQQGDNSEQSEQQDGQQPSEQGEQSDQKGEQSDSESDQQNKPEMQSESEKSPQSGEQKPEQSPEQQDAQPEPSQSDEQAKQQAEQQAMQAQAAELTNEEKEKAQQLNQLLRKVPDDPAILLRNKMQLEAQKRNYQRRPRGAEKSW